MNIINYGKALSSISGNEYIRSFIGKVKFEKIKDIQNKKAFYKAKEVKKNKNISIIEIACFCNNDIFEKMTVTIVLNCNMNNKKKDISNNFHVNENEYIQFSKKDIEEFSFLVSDMNPIHLEEKAVVQGMLIIKRIIDNYNISNGFNIRFLNPAYEMEKIYMYKYNNENKKAIEGTSKSFKYFEFLEG
ncbi:hypothetical protein ACTNDG_04685 [Clostridium sp. HCP1S3_B4]|uniref:hypothetical protein n=1 Tax=unclassified Clostridium TaxID=2614128 RepID=UPI0016B67065|nr:hypothetical protein [Clostridiales bacterium]MDY2730578.1 hypothetical protein [Clostridium sp.]NLK24551.1 hypothetical protein [Clostridiales bacterium]